jgi:hypothetical protein
VLNITLKSSNANILIAGKHQHTTRLGRVTLRHTNIDWSKFDLKLSRIKRNAEQLSRSWVIEISFPLLLLRSAMGHRLLANLERYPETCLQ